MLDFRPFLLGCSAAVLLSCTACASSQPPAASSSAPPFPDTPAPSASAEDLLPDEPSAPAIYIPEQPPVVFSTPDAPAPSHQPEQPAPPSGLLSTEPSPSPSEPSAEIPATSQPLPPDASHSNYDFSQPVPESEAVNSSYFSDAAFVGDSRSEGFYLYGVKRGKNISSSGLSVFTFSKKRVFTAGGKSCTGLELLSAKEYGKVYLGFGTNELGYINANAFYDAYCETIDAVRACQPYAVVYAQTIAPVNEGRVAATGGKKHLNNDRVRMYNELIRKAAQEKCVPLLDLYSALVVDGSLPADASRDGIHINREYCQKQLNYLMCHTVDFDTLYPQPQTEPEVLSNETTGSPVVEPDAGPDILLPNTEPDPLPGGSAPTASGV